MRELSEGGKEELAVALILLKDFKSGGRFDADVIIRVMELAEHLGVKSQFESLLTKIPPMKIVERYPVED